MPNFRSNLDHFRQFTSSAVFFYKKLFIEWKSSVTQCSLILFRNYYSEPARRTPLDIFQQTPVPSNYKHNRQTQPANATIVYTSTGAGVCTRVSEVRRSEAVESGFPYL